MTIAVLRPRAARTWFQAQADRRGTRPWLGIVGVALAASAVLLNSDDLALPLLAVCAWWWCPRERFVWVLPLGLGVITLAWVSVGAGLMAILPLSTAGLLWIASAAWAADLAAVARAVTNGRRP